MKILIVNTSDLSGGAARAAFRLFQGLNRFDINCHMLVVEKGSDHSKVLSEESKFRKVINKLRPTMDSLYLKRYKNRQKIIFSPSKFPFSNVVEKINREKPDIVHLHWIVKGMMTVEDLVKIEAPIVWSLHDMWAFTGGCHYDRECGKYKKSCGSCPQLNSQEDHDLSRDGLTRKALIYSQLKSFKVIGLSRWMQQSALASFPMKNCQVLNLPNPIDSKTYKRIDQKVARELFNLPLGKKLILFGAMGPTSDERKGFKFFEQMFEDSFDFNNTEFVIFGASEGSIKFPVPTHYMGILKDDVSLATLYNACDVMVVPSIQENLSNAIVESLACGLPVVAFDIGGNSDMIDHQKNGYLAQPFDSKDLARGIKWVLENENQKELEDACFQKVMKTFDESVVIPKYINLYREMIGES